ncbi:MAG: hypothetical protein FWE91_08350 [Defluviitaleaceae bacterium]|nr:hypothetical protein [Defluviitaleaceae bacterium]MCL2835302.1 hypothetical protein [Defluviitaleaceae bacterium]
MQPEYAENEVYKLIASWVECCGYKIRYKVRENEENAAYTLPDEYGESSIQMYTNNEIYIQFGKYFGTPNCHDDIYTEIGASNVLAHELAHQIFTNVSNKPFAKLFSINPEYEANRVMVDNEEACDAFGNFLYTLAERIINGAVIN